MLDVKELSCGYGRKVVVNRFSLSLGDSEILCLLGANGVGKTTLFRTILGLQPSLGGEILLDGEDMSGWTSCRRARSIAYVPQAHVPPFPFRAEDVVVMGSASRLRAFEAPSVKDRDSARAVLDSLGIAHLADRVYTEISGGERQLVLVARALVQKPRILVLDEPTSSLDFANQTLVLERIKDLARTGMGIIMTTHSPAHAFLCSTKVTLMGKNGWMANGVSDDVLNEENLMSAFGIPVHIVDITLGNGTRVRTCVPLLSREREVSQLAV